MDPEKDQNYLGTLANNPSDKKDADAGEKKKKTKKIVKKVKKSVEKKEVEAPAVAPDPPKAEDEKKDEIALDGDSIPSVDLSKYMVSAEDEWMLLPPLNEEEWHLPNYNIKYKSNVRHVACQVDMEYEDAELSIRSCFCSCAKCSA